MLAPTGEIQEALFPDLLAYRDPADALCGSDTRSRWLARARLLGSEGNKTPQKAAQAVLDALALAGSSPSGTQGVARQALAVLRKGFFVAG